MERETKAGSRSRTRTCDPVINSHLLYRLSYPGMALNTVRSIRIAHIRSRADSAGLALPSKHMTPAQRELRGRHVENLVATP